MGLQTITQGGCSLTVSQSLIWQTSSAHSWGSIVDDAHQCYWGHYACKCALLLSLRLMSLDLYTLGDSALDRKVIHMPVNGSLCLGGHPQEALKG